MYIQAGGFSWAVEGGRRDGRISRESEVLGNLPPPSFDVNELTQLFASKTLSQEEMVILSGTPAYSLIRLNELIKSTIDYN